MLNDYIVDYIKAEQDGDKKKMDKLEKELAKLGMDRMTLRLLVDELEKNSKIADFLLTPR